MEHQLQLEHLSELSATATEYSQFGDKYIYARLSGDRHVLRNMERPIRLDCLTILLCSSGRFEAEINMRRYSIESHTLVVLPPGMLIQAHTPVSQKMDVYVLHVSREFLVDINIDLNALNIRSLIEKRCPAVALNPAEVSKLRKYFDLLDINARDSQEDATVFIVNVARSLAAAVFYQLLQINFARISRYPDDGEKSQSRRTSYVHEFMRLVHMNYARHRSVSFYAEQLGISPKYLTMVVKEASGRSAAEWINEFVVVEAKNLLRFSGKNIQQVAYALNFNNQSAFGKYFKHLTGQSPSEYQKS